LITVERLRKSFGRVRAVDDLSFDVGAGSLFAFLGSNGAGKSTTISCMTTALRADSGSMVINGNRVGAQDDRVRRDIGVVFQDSLLDPVLSTRENLLLRGGLYGKHSVQQLRHRVDELADIVDLGDFIDRRYGQLSGGQKRRADIARALVHNPSVLFLDEPTAGLDPHSRQKVWNAIATLRETEGLTVFLTTHYMEEAENANSVMIIDYGRSVAFGTPLELRTTYSTTLLRGEVLEQDGWERVGRVLARLGMSFSRNEKLLEVHVAEGQSAFDIAQALGSALSRVEIRHGSMDQVFLSLTREGNDE
jgi:multidrug/hemolysin transport system ATP-binding protein